MKIQGRSIIGFNSAPESDTSIKANNGMTGKKMAEYKGHAAVLDVLRAAVTRRGERALEQAASRCSRASRVISPHLILNVSAVARKVKKSFPPLRAKPKHPPLSQRFSKG